MQNDRYDVIIVGGGAAGVNAAIQAGRSGARALLVEKNGRLGGVTVNSGINYPGLFHAWGKQIIRGTGWELVERTVRESGGTLPDFSQVPARHFAHQIGVDMMIYPALCDELIVDAGTEILHHTMAAAATRNGDGWRLTVCTKEGLRELEAKVLIDCTGDANLVSMAGFKLRDPGASQPATLSCFASGYDLDTLDMDAVNVAFCEAVERGEVKASDGGWRIDQPSISHWLRSRGQNGNHIEATPDARTSAGRSAMEIEGRRAIYRVYSFLRRQPGFEKLRIDWVSPEVGIRETVTIEGEETVTLEDFRTSRIYPEAICYAYYPIDLHGMRSYDWQTPALPKGALATIPRGALIPRGSRNLLAAGRCFSSDRLANSALRVQVPCMAMGQAAGALAALAVQHRTTINDLAIDLLTDHLREHDAIIPPDLG